MTTLVGLLMSVAMTVAEAMLVKQNKANNVHDKASDTDAQHPVGVFDAMLVMRQSLDCLNDDREAKGDEKH